MLNKTSAQTATEFEQASSNVWTIHFTKYTSSHTLRQSLQLIFVISGFQNASEQWLNI